MIPNRMFRIGLIAGLLLGSQVICVGQVISSADHPTIATLTSARSSGTLGFSRVEQTYDLYRAYAALEGRFASDDTRLHTNMFVPLYSDQHNLFFADLRGQFIYQGGGEGNWGLAYRHLFDSQWIWGVDGFYDLKQSVHQNWFHQGTMGMELMSDVWDFRVNGYIPEGGSSAVVNATAVISGGNLFVQNNQERAYGGFDAEIGTLLARFPKWHDSEVRGFAGMYHFDTSSESAVSVTGPRLRAEWRCFDLPFLAMDSRLTLGAQYQNDDVRGGQSAMTLAVRMPFGPDRGRKRRLTRLERRMTDVIVRDIDVVTQPIATPGGLESAVHAKHGYAIGSVTMLDAQTENLIGVFASATTDTVIVDGSKGDIVLNDSLQLQANQQLFGGGLVVKGVTTGVEATIGSPVTLRGTDPTKAVILTADNSVVGGLRTLGGLHGISSVLPGGTFADLVNVQVVHNTVQGAADHGLAFGRLDSDSRVAFNDSLQNGATGFYFHRNYGVIEYNKSRTNEEHGFDLWNNYGTIQGNIAFHNGDNGIYTASNFGTIHLNDTFENGSSGFRVFANTGFFTSNGSYDNEAEGFWFDDNDGTISQNTAYDNLRDGFDLDDNNGDFLDNDSQDNGNDGYEFANNTGTFSENYANGNGVYGFRFLDNDGVMEDNYAEYNDAAGFAFNNNNDQFVDNASENNDGSGFLFEDNTGDFLENYAEGNSNNGFTFNDNDGTFDDNASYYNEGKGFDFVDNNFEFTWNDADGNLGNGFDFYRNYDDFSFNTSDYNGGNGYDFIENAFGGAMSDNNATENDGIGYNGVNDGDAERNTGTDNAGGGNVFP